MTRVTKQNIYVHYKTIKYKIPIEENLGITILLLAHIFYNFHGNKVIQIILTDIFWISIY